MCGRDVRSLNGKEGTIAIRIQLGGSASVDVLEVRLDIRRLNGGYERFVRLRIGRSRQSLVLPRRRCRFTTRRAFLDREMADDDT